MLRNHSLATTGIWFIMPYAILTGLAILVTYL